MAKVYRDKITPEGFKLLEEEIIYLKDTIQALSRELSDAKSQGDLKENQAVTDISRELENSERRLAGVNEALNTVVVERITPSDFVDFGATVELKNFPKQGVIKRFKLVGDYESSIVGNDESSDDDICKISTSSNLAQMLYRKKVGDTIVIGPKNKKIDIINITYK
jgi:transcription elongation factor GreA